MEKASAEHEFKTFRQRAKIVGENILHWMFDPAVIGVVRSNSAVEADIDDRGLMQHYVDHPETDRDKPLFDSSVISST